MISANIELVEKKKEEYVRRVYPSLLAAVPPKVINALRDRAKNRLYRILDEDRSERRLNQKSTF